jgi:hypothetical protein
VSEKYNHEIGYESLLKDFERYRKQSPRGVSLAKDKSSILLQFKIGSKSRSKYGCNCSFSLDGMLNALSKAHKVAEALKSFASEVEFWQWYDKEIRENGAIRNDVLTFSEAIAKVEQDFWDRPDRRKRKRDKNNPSDKSTWNRAYQCFYKHLDKKQAVSTEGILKALTNIRKGTKNYKCAVSAMKKLCRTSKRNDILQDLDESSTLQTEYAELQTITLDDFLKWRDNALGITTELHPNADVQTRQCWLWVFSIQVVYGLRIHEVFAIENLDKPFTTKDKKVIPALNDPSNIDNAIVVGSETAIGTSTKTGYRLARPIIPPTHPNLMDILKIKIPLLPVNKPKGTNKDRITRFYADTARYRLIRWNAP